MLDTDTKRRIDTCRDILVGKVPDPKSQVEQITIALIYKFMDDMDAETIDLDGTPTFFTKDFERYRWAKLVAPGVSGQEMLNTYSEALTKMVENEGLPKLFRDIFRNAYLPYRDPETLRAFLREIDAFTYDHSERLGDAFEYLLSVLGSQGDAGQFRTPRHIIDFMVEIIDPKKTEVILDPACGTAGFLISAYKHILKRNSTGVTNGNGISTEGDAAEQALESPMRYPGDLLQPDDRTRLSRNIKGYDISPDMVRLSLVNLYLHAFADPKVEEYDTLTSEDKWTEMADVILANPPFMSPKGGIKPHTRFQVQSKRSEVLFVDYIAEHLTPNGRAAIVVPEGIIFQSQTAYRDLRKMLVENHLAAVISLPAGVFNPYSGVKTSILILDRAVAKASKHVAFFKIENDGFALGAQRKAVKGSQLAQVKAELGAWLQTARAGGGEGLESSLGSAVERVRLADGGDYNLSGERYLERTASASAFEMVELGRFMASGLPSIDPSKSPEERFELWSIPAHEGREPERPLGKEIGSAKKGVLPNDVLLSRIVPHIRRTWVVSPSRNVERQIASGEWIVFRSDEFVPEYLARVLVSDFFHAQFMQTVTGVGGSLSRANPKAVAEIRIPLPPLEVQREIVAEVEGYQRVIDGARAVLTNYRPHIPVDPEWPVVPMAEIAEFKNGLNFTKSDDSEPLRIVGVSDFQSNTLVPSDGLATIQPDAPVGQDYLLQPGDILFVRSNGNPDLVGRSMLVGDDIGRATFSGFTIRARFNASRATPRYLAHFFKTPVFSEKMKKTGQGANIRNLSQGILSELQVPLPDVDTQIAIVADIEAELVLVNGNRDLIARFEKKIDAAIARVWGEAKAEVAA
ncbi:N-6 DNA methylase [Paracoccus zhejiangensis]|uniref:site-specific DNA-methyltransferase (adenine-specific) n=1 Tax=Paracoccus zhejiangensis TaxID=1077935 RepID=A0A2H5F5N0_9RHOB|nr:N-6 DNA methylase [Paracoccus zhejiangensis]AUH66861.1 N-6 DNA methylase [Paracoccus zhejiangensis]